MNTKLVYLKRIEQAEKGEYYIPQDIDFLLNKIGEIDFIKHKKDYVANISCSFDIETSSCVSDTQKLAFMYMWSFCIDGFVIIGRKWQEFIDMLDILTERLNLTSNTILPIYVHNLAFEFQFIRKKFSWETVFSLKERKPIKARTIDGIEFRCSYLLSGYSLSKLSEQLLTYKVKKLVGELNYDLIRSSETKLSNKEIQYSINDVLVVFAYIQEKIEKLGNISKITLTKTGVVREYCRNNCLFGGNEKHTNNKKFSLYRKIMKKLVLNEEEYLQCKRAFAGGFTHASPIWSDMIIPNVHSYDFTSSYPYVMLSEKFPMSKPKLVSINNDEELDNYLLHYCCLFELELFNVSATLKFENYIAKSHCRELKNAICNNGRIVKAEHLVITVTEQDYFIIYQMYDWKDSNIKNFRIFRRDYLPTDFVKSILQLYHDKTTLKGVKGKESEYMVSKENLNSCYGMSVTDICRDEILYNTDWGKDKPNIENALEKYNKSIKRFLYYPWGIWVTAYARANLFTGILEFKEDYIYSDTDSIKVVNIDKHKKYIDTYNKDVVKKLKKAMQYHGIDFNLTCPTNIKGEKLQLGVWDYEGMYDNFKTLGAKRYMINKPNALSVSDTQYDFSITVAGVNKTFAIPYIVKKYKNPFECFEDGLVIPKEYTGKLTHTYIDEEKDGELYDYLGNKFYFHEDSAIHLEKAEYSLSMTDEYLDYIFLLRDDYNY